MSRQRKVKALQRPQVILMAVLGALLVVSTAAYLVVNRKETIAITVTVEAPNGGVFESSTKCVPKNNYVPLLDALTISDINQAAITIPEATWTYVDGQACAKTFAISLSPGTSYRVALGSTEIGTISEAAFVRRTETFIHTIVVTQDLRGKLELRQKADSCRNNSNGWSCTWYPSWQVSLDLNENTGTCSGNGGYDDIKRGASVKIYSSDDRLVATSEVASTSYDLQSVKSRVIYCEASWSVNDVPNDDKGYYVELVKRGKVFFSVEELMLNGWTLDTVLGD